MIEILDRKAPPLFSEFENIEFQHAVTGKLSNGIEVNYLNAGTQNVVKIELIFLSGNWNEKKPLTAKGCSDLFTSGTKTKSEDELTKIIDFYGSYVKSTSHHDYTSFSLFSLNKHLKSVLPLFMEMIISPAFPENELDTYRTNKIQGLKVKKKKVEFLARNKFFEVMYGSGHPYGRSATEQEYAALKSEDLVEFSNSNFLSGKAVLVVSGKITAEVMKDIENVLGSQDFLNRESGGEIFNNSNPAKPSEEKKHFIKKENAVQSAIRIGKRTGLIGTKDYVELSIVNTILGGYFGSRLMTNIREEKGYTYGIHSSMFSFFKSGNLVISTEVGAEVCEAALKEIYFEIEQLSEKTVSPEELKTVRNYMMGSFLGSIDGPFALAEKFIKIKLFGLDYAFYTDYFRTLKEITPEKIRETARQYLDPSSFYEVVAGR